MSSHCFYPEKSLLERTASYIISVELRPGNSNAEMVIVHAFFSMPQLLRVKFLGKMQICFIRTTMVEKGHQVGLEVFVPSPFLSILFLRFPRCDRHRFIYLFKH